MGLLDSLGSFFVSEAFAEEPREEPEKEEEEEEDEKSRKGGPESEEEDKESEEGGAGEDEDEEEEDDADEDEEEEEEPEDLMPKLHDGACDSNPQSRLFCYSLFLGQSYITHAFAECSKTPSCSHAKYEYEECSERVQKWQEADEDERKSLGPKEDCVEECACSI